MALKDLTADAVRTALDEFDKLGRDAFLNKYGFGRARGYYVVRQGKPYDSKALAGAAHGFLGLGSQPLTPKEFSGGERATADALRKLGFEVPSPGEALHRGIPFEPGRTYSRKRDIHEQFGGQERGGIATPDGGPFVFLFTGESGGEYGYRDGWREDGSFGYTGEGQRGDMTFVRGNRAIRDHLGNGKDLLLFEALPKKGAYRFLGCFICGSWEFAPAKDKDGHDRQAIVFELIPNVDSEVQIESVSTPAAGKTLAQLRAAAYSAASLGQAGTRSGARTFYKRSATVRDYVLMRANGVCECCEKPAPFVRPDGSPYLEPHHINRVADGGPDHPKSVAGICPSCHREIHHGQGGYQVNSRLRKMIIDKEAGEVRDI